MFSLQCYFVVLFLCHLDLMISFAFGGLCCDCGLFWVSQVFGFLVINWPKEKYSLSEFSEFGQYFCSFTLAILTKQSSVLVKGG